MRSVWLSPSLRAPSLAIVVALACVVGASASCGAPAVCGPSAACGPSASCGALASCGAPQRSAAPLVASTSSAPPSALGPSASSASLPAPASSSGSPSASAPSPPPGERPPKSGEAGACAPLKVDLPALLSVDPSLDAPVPPIVDASGSSMAAFYERFARLIRGRTKDHVRIGVYGDSNLTRDQFTGWLRRSLQPRYGDGGHGYVAAARPWEWYLHTDVVHSCESRAWNAYASSTHPAPDKLYGFAGISAESLQRGARTFVETAGPEAPVGTHVSRFEVYFAKRPRGGTFAINVDGAPKASVSTQSPTLAAGFFQLEVPDGPHRFDIITTDSAKSVRLFGSVLERSDPGIVIDALGVGGASCPSFIKQDPATAIDALRHRKYDLIIFAFGSNYSDTSYLPTCMKTLIDVQREALPGVPLLLFGPPDFADPKLPLSQSSPQTVKRGALLEKVARDNAAAFWDYRAAMGGELSIVRFRSHGLAWVDNVHLTDKGMKYMANRFEYALFQGLQGHLAAHADAGCAGD